MVWNKGEINNLKLIIEYKKQLETLFYCECCKDYFDEREIWIDEVEIERGKIIKMCEDCRRDFDGVWGCDSCYIYKLNCSKWTDDTCIDCWRDLFNRLKVKGLKEECKDRKIKGYSRLRKRELINLLLFSLSDY